eukprot:4500601-Prymnesium_polylepis.1
MRKTRDTIQAIESEDDRAAARAAWAASMSAVINQLKERFSRLLYNGENIRVLPPATPAKIKQQHTAIKATDPSWEPHMTTQAELAKCSLLQEYFKAHVREQHKYLFIVGKCGRSDCKFNCGPLRMPHASFDWLSSRPRIVPFPMHRASSGRDHFAPYDELKCVPTTEAHLPSYQAPAQPPPEAKAADKKKFKFGTTNYARAIIICADCSKPRLLFASKDLTPNET